MVAESTWLPKAPVGKASRRVLLGRLYPRGQIPDPESVVTRLSVPMVDANVLRSRQGGADARTQEGPTRAGRRVRLCRPRAGVETRFPGGDSLSDVRAAGGGVRHGHPRCAPGKKPLIKLSYRPPNYETPASHFSSPLTANDAFFVRYHLADIPEQIDLPNWRLRVGGEGAANPFELTMADLQNGFEQVEITAVCQCAGNRRGLSEPHVLGVQWGLGAMGNAVWKGVRLKDVLAKAGLRKETVEVVLNGADGPVIDKTPDFIKSIPIWKALDDNTIVALRMNGQPLPHFNGFPARLGGAGWTGTYWMKHLVSIDAVAKPFQGFWMKSAYRIPIGKFP